MSLIKSFSITRKCDEEEYNKFDTIRRILKLKQNEGILKAITEFNTNHPIDKVSLITDFTSGKPPMTLPPVSLYTNFKELRKICSDMDKDKLLMLKEQAKKFLTAIELEMESRVSS